MTLVIAAAAVLMLASILAVRVSLIREARRVRRIVESGNADALHELADECLADGSPSATRLAEELRSLADDIDEVDAEFETRTPLSQRLKFDVPTFTPPDRGTRRFP